MITRTDYLQSISHFIDVPLIKIFCGVRRSGKSTILLMIQDLLKQKGVNDKNIISKRYTSFSSSQVITAKDMYNDLTSILQSNSNQKKYLFLDEIQEVEGWEKVINSIFESFNVDLYITGSNSKLMSSEISTYLTGRYVQIPVYTLSFSEYLAFKGKSKAEAKNLFTEYVQEGGFPLIGINNFDKQTAYQIVDGVYASVITRDISLKHEIRNVELFERVVLFVIENIGNTFSASSIIKFLKNENRSLSVESVYNYLKWLCDAFILYPCKRYDLQGKEILKTQEKYYLSDVSFKYAKLGFNTNMLSGVFENIVFLELKRRGYEVFIGKKDTKEIDFVAIKRETRIYIQVCVKLPSQSDREVLNLMQIKDNYRKYIVCYDDFAKGNINGIEFINIADFLLKEEW